MAGSVAFGSHLPFGRMTGIRADPAFVDIADRKRVEVVPALAATADGDDEIRRFQHIEMLHHGAAVERGEGCAQRAGGQRIILQAIENLTPDRGRQSLENAVLCRVG